MDKHEIKGKWKLLSARIRQEWGDLTDDEVTRAEGNLEELIARIQQKYGQGRQAISKKLNELKDSLEES
ncbi:MAG TPA: CsbD family protein [Wenzhouxiangella sp.]|nr:CsbD family protein [Wenzhouxiangella sp.]